MWRYCLHDPGDESNTIACLKRARAIIKQTLQLYSLDELSISFNGHKDCTGLLCLLHAAMNKLSLPAQELKALYFLYKSQFPQAEEFISETTRRYNLNLITGNIRTGMRILKETQPRVKGTHHQEAPTILLKPKPPLKCSDGGNKYKPAYMLEDGNLERAGRI